MKYCLGFLVLSFLSPIGCSYEYGGTQLYSTEGSHYAPGARGYINRMCNVADNYHRCELNRIRYSRSYSDFRNHVVDQCGTFKSYSDRLNQLEFEGSNNLSGVARAELLNFNRGLLGQIVQLDEDAKDCIYDRRTSTRRASCFQDAISDRLYYSGCS